MGPGIRFKQFDDDVDPKQLEIFFNRFYDQLVRHKPHLTRLNFLSGASLYQVFKERFGSNYNLYTFITSKDFLELKSPSKKLPSGVVYENTDIPQQNQSGLKIPLNKSNSFVAYTQNQTTQLSLSRGEDVFITYKLYPGGKGISFKIIPFINTIYVLNNKDPNLSFIVSFYIYKKPINGKVASVSVYNIHRYRPGGNGTTLHTPDRKNTPEEAAVRAHESRKYLMNRQFDMYDHLYALEQYAEMIYKFFSAKVFRTKQDPNPSKLPDELFTRMTELAMQPQYSEEFVSVFNNMDKGVQSITELNTVWNSIIIDLLRKLKTEGYDPTIKKWEIIVSNEEEDEGGVALVSPPDEVLRRSTRTLVPPNYYKPDEYDTSFRQVNSTKGRFGKRDQPIRYYPYRSSRRR